MAAHKRNEEEKPERRSGPGDYFTLGSLDGSWEIDYETAARIGRALDRRKRPRWMKFVDLHGGRVWVRTNTIVYVTESHERHRSQQHTFHYLHDKERSSAYRRSHEDEDGDE
jgi:hypothetical protein